MACLGVTGRHCGGMKQSRDWSLASRESAFSTQIRGSEKKQLTGAWVAALLPIFILGFFMVWVHMPFFFKPGVPNPIAIILGLVAAMLIGRAIWETIRLKRFGDPVLDLTQVPVPLGGTIEGRINLNASLTTAPDFSIKLQCIRRVLQQSGKNSHWVETPLWTGEGTASLLPGGIVPVTMQVPPDQEETNSLDAFNQLIWRLTVKAPFRGPAFLEIYEIPVEGRTSAAQKIADERARITIPPPSGKSIFLKMLPILLVGLAIFGGGLYLLSLGVADVRKASTSAGWPTVPGQVSSSIPPRSGAFYVSRTDSDFAYAYEVNGVGYTGHTVYPHILWRQPAASKISRTYPRGSDVTVYYAPGDPATSCLQPGLRTGAFQRLVMGLLVMTVGFLFAASAAFAPRDAVMSGNSMSFREGSTGSKVMGYSFLALVLWGVALWWVS
jgi:hypothetical protein